LAARQLGEIAFAPACEPARRAFDLRVRPTEARIDAQALQHNLKEARRAAPRALICAVVKADGYGHGAAIAARSFLAAGAEWLGVALVEEGLALRNVGITAPILCLGGQYTDYGLLLQHRLTPLVYRLDMIEGLAAAARARGVTAEAHLKMDTGMGRIGAQPEDLAGLLDLLRNQPEVRITGLASHFANADLHDPTATRKALDLFADARRAILDAGQPLAISHLANSAAVPDLPPSHYDMVRPGLMLYGAAPAPRFAGMADLRPAMSWVTGISHLKHVRAGTPISYGHKWTARRDSVIATLPVGYADGYRHALQQQERGAGPGKACEAGRDRLHGHDDGRRHGRFRRPPRRRGRPDGRSGDGTHLRRRSGRTLRHDSVRDLLRGRKPRSARDNLTQVSFRGAVRRRVWWVPGGGPRGYGGQTQPAPRSDRPPSSFQNLARPGIFE
jgi:alanine racemase